MLQNDFYTVHDLHYEASVLSCRLRFNADHDIFKGHFPLQPVVPGVCMMQIVKELVEGQTGRRLMISRAPQVKFLQLIVPGTEPLAEISWEVEGGDFRLSAVFRNETSAVFKMAATLLLLS